MIIKCPTCDGALEYNVEKGLLVCKYCNSFFTAEEIGRPETDPADEENVTASEGVQSPGGTSAWDWDMQRAKMLTRAEEITNAGTKAAGAAAGVSFASAEEIREKAEDARNSDITGDIRYDYSPEERKRTVDAYYEEQRKLHEQYQNAPRVDYTKPYVSRIDAMDGQTSRAEEALAAYEAGRTEKVDRVKAYYEEQQRKHEEYMNRPSIDYSKPYSGTTRELMTPEQRLEADAKALAEARADCAAGGFAAGLAINDSLKSKIRNNLNSQQRVGSYTPGGQRIVYNSKAFLTTDTPVDDGNSTIDNKIYTCTTCGAELAINGVEISSFCSYCGQPTIVYDRMEKSKMPEYIIPFVVTRDEALKAIRKKLNSGWFVPNEVKNFEVERLCGIYIPYWLFDADYTDSMVIRSRVKSGKSSVTKHYRVNTSCKLYYYPVDASRNLNDKCSQKLEPYDYSGIRPFQIGYMSGFYSDRFDMTSDQMMITSMFRAQRLMYEEAKKKTPGSPQGIADSYPMFHVKKQYYTLLPAWFMTFRYENVPYTIMVNGQTGKVVGTVPYAKRKFWGVFGGIFAGLSGLGSLFVFLSWKTLNSGFKIGDGMKIYFFLFSVAFVIFIFTRNSMKHYESNIKLAREEQMTKYVKERQDV